MKYITIDFGAAVTRIGMDGRVIAIEPSVLAAEIFSGGNFAEDSEYVAFGTEAESIHRNTPGTVALVRPFFDDTSADYGIMYEYADQLLLRYQKELKLRGASVLITLPEGLPKAAERSVRDALHRAGARSVGVVSAPVAAAMGAGLLTDKKDGGRLLIDLGSFAVKLALVSEGKLLYADHIHEAGAVLDLAIADTVCKSCGILPDIREAQAIKLGICRLQPGEDEPGMEFVCKKTFSGIPGKVILHSDRLRPAVLEHYQSLIDAIGAALAKVSPGVLRQVAQNGILLSGMGAEAGGLCGFLEDFTGVRAAVLPEPGLCTLRGLMHMAENEWLLPYASFEK